MPRKYHLCLFKPDHPRFRIMDSHREVLDSLHWGFQACGVDCSAGINTFDRQRTNIVFGWIIAAQMGALADLPEDTILYNFEQYSEKRIADTPMAALARRFQIWDYSAANLPRWQECGPRVAPFHAPVCWAPVLERIAPAEPEIDALFIGSIGPCRQARLAEIAGLVSRPSVVSICNVWGAARDAYIGRSRLLLNVWENQPHLRIFEEVRVSYYLANRKAVVCEAVPGQHIADDMRTHLVMAPAAELAATCERLLADPQAQAQHAEEGYAMFRRRDVRTLLRTWLG
jgi:hypothetical protein